MPPVASLTPSRIRQRWCHDVFFFLCFRQYKLDCSQTKLLQVPHPFYCWFLLLIVAWKERRIQNRICHNLSMKKLGLSPLGILVVFLIAKNLLIAGWIIFWKQWRIYWRSRISMISLDPRSSSCRSWNFQRPTAKKCRLLVRAADRVKAGFRKSTSKEDIFFNWKVFLFWFFRSLANFCEQISFYHGEIVKIELIWAIGIMWKLKKMAQF